MSQQASPVEDPASIIARPDWDHYFMKMAYLAAERATCNRKHVGAVIVKNKMVLSTGYNGAPRGLPHCDDGEHELVNMNGRDSCIRTVHAEANAIAQAARSGTAIEGATLYTTASPCYDCMKLIINSGIAHVLCGEFYQSRYGRSEDMAVFATKAGVTVNVLT